MRRVDRPVLILDSLIYYVILNKLSLFETFLFDKFDVTLYKFKVYSLKWYIYMICIYIMIWLPLKQYLSCYITILQCHCLFSLYYPLDFCGLFTGLKFVCLYPINLISLPQPPGIHHFIPFCFVFYRFDFFRFNI